MKEPPNNQFSIFVYSIPLRTLTLILASHGITILIQTLSTSDLTRLKTVQTVLVDSLKNDISVVLLAFPCRGPEPRRPGDHNFWFTRPHESVRRPQVANSPVHPRRSTVVRCRSSRERRILIDTVPTVQNCVELYRRLPVEGQDSGPAADQEPDKLDCPRRRKGQQ